jgi:ribosome biogenesis GTPase
MVANHVQTRSPGQKVDPDGMSGVPAVPDALDTPDVPWPSTEEVLTGTVLRAVSRIYDVQADTPVGRDGIRLFRCLLRDKLRKELILTESKGRAQRVREVRRLAMMEPVVAGDRVRFRAAPSSGRVYQEGVIEEVLPRSRELSRQAVTTGSVPVGQTIVANLDLLLLVFAAADPEPHPGLIDRFLVSCESARLPALLCINKCDLGISDDLAHDLGVYERVGYRVLRTSAATGQGIDALRAIVAGKISAFVGPSGAGKSTLLNALEPGLGLRVGAISRQTRKGTHTTRFAQLIPLGAGGFLADTPGLRQLGLWDVSVDELDRLFPEFRPFLAGCRFGNCAHIDEDGCAVKDAVARGEIDERRYDYYVKLFEETADATTGRGR